MEGLKNLIKVCYAACPKEIAWTPQEAYGEFNIEDHNKVVRRVLYCVTPTQQVQAYFLWRTKGRYRSSRS